MKKNLVIVVIVIIVLVIGAWWFFGRGGGTSTSDETGQETSVSEGESFTGKLKDILSLGQAMKCTWEQAGDSSGTAYLKNKQYYAEVTDSGKTGYIIIDKNNCLWTWEKGVNQGVKICYEPAASGEEGDYSSSYTQGGVPNVDYACLPTAVSDSKFSPPTNVNFMELGF